LPPFPCFRVFAVVFLCAIANHRRRPPPTKQEMMHSVFTLRSRPSDWIGGRNFRSSDHPRFVYLPFHIDYRYPDCPSGHVSRPILFAVPALRRQIPQSSSPLGCSMEGVGNFEDHVEADCGTRVRSRSSRHQPISRNAFISIQPNPFTEPAQVTPTRLQSLQPVYSLPSPQHFIKCANPLVTRQHSYRLNTLLQLGSNFTSLRTSSHVSSDDSSLYRAKPSMPTAQLVRPTRQTMEEARSSDLPTTS
jgi:hypothetical protein